MAKKAKQSKSGSLKKTYAIPLWQIVVFVVLFAGIGVYAISQSSAAPAKKGGTKATLFASLNPNAANTPTQITVTGCGYNADKYTITNVLIQKDGVGGGGSYNTGVNPDGCLMGIPDPKVVDAYNYRMFQPGTYTISIKQSINGKISRQPQAQTSLVVQ